MVTVQKIGHKWVYFLGGIRSLNTYTTKKDAARNGSIALAYYASLKGK